MTKIGLLVICLLSGFVLRRTPFFDASSPKVLNSLIVYFFIPVITLYQIPKINFEWNLVWLSVTPFMVYFFSFICMKMWSRITQADRKTEGALIMTCGIGSTSFVGFPIFEILYGSAGLSYGIILSLAGTIFVFNTVGLSTGLYYAQQSPNHRALLKKILTFPPLVVFFIAILLNISNISIPPVADEVLGILAAPFSVVALLTIGMQIDFEIDREFLKNILAGQLFKLVIAPLIIYVFMWHILDLQDVVAKVCILGAAIGSMNAVSIVAAQLGLNPRLSTLMPAIGIPLSVPVLFIVDWLLTSGT